MITVLLPEQISKHWDVIGYAIEQSLPPIASGNDERMNRALSSLLSGKSLCWVSHTNNESGKFLEAVFVTQIVVDSISSVKNLLLYSVYGFSKVDENSWAKGLELLTKYAKTKGCESIVAYTQNDKIKEIASKFGCDSSWAFLTFSIDKILGG